MSDHAWPNPPLTHTPPITHACFPLLATDYHSSCRIHYLFSITIGHPDNVVQRDGGRDINRQALYPIPAQGDPRWGDIGILPPRTDRSIRILRSHHTVGLLGIGVSPDGTTRAIDWGGVPALLLLNPFEYLWTHPEVEEVWMETVDDDTYSESHGTGNAGRVSSVYSHSNNGGDTASVRTSTTESSASSYTPFEGALVLRRSEFSYDLARIIREMQHEAFDELGIDPPAVAYFRNTLHGR